MELPGVSASTPTPGDKNSEHVYFSAATPRDSASKPRFAANATDNGSPRSSKVPRRSNTKDGSASGDSEQLEKKEAKEETPTSFQITQLYRYATGYDYLLLAVGITTVSVNGVLFPLMAIVFGD
ncbi:hypothetical protein PybrP1_003333, partial [[Pythium] brassicae (nom. inval.)]